MNKAELQELLIGVRIPQHREIVDVTHKFEYGVHEWTLSVVDREENKLYDPKFRSQKEMLKWVLGHLTYFAKQFDQTESE